MTADPIQYEVVTDPREREFVIELYGKLRAVGVTRLICSRRTYEQHLDYDIIVAGPWEWTISDAVPYGSVHLVKLGNRVGTLTVSELAITDSVPAPGSVIIH